MTTILQRILNPISGVLVLAWHFESLHSLVAQFSVAWFKLFAWTALFFWIDIFDSDYVFCLPDVPFLPDWADFWSTFSGASLTPVNLPLCFCTCVHICECANTHTNLPAFPRLPWPPKLTNFLLHNSRCQHLRLLDLDPCCAIQVFFFNGNVFVKIFIFIYWKS